MFHAVNSRFVNKPPAKRETRNDKTSHYQDNSGPISFHGIQGEPLRLFCMEGEYMKVNQYSWQYSCLGKEKTDRGRIFILTCQAFPWALRLTTRKCTNSQMKMRVDVERLLTIPLCFFCKRLNRKELKQLQVNSVDCFIKH